MYRLVVNCSPHVSPSRLALTQLSNADRSGPCLPHSKKYSFLFSVVLLCYVPHQPQCCLGRTGTKLTRCCSVLSQNIHNVWVCLNWFLVLRAASWRDTTWLRQDPRQETGRRFTQRRHVIYRYSCRPQGTNEDRPCTPKQRTASGPLTVSRVWFFRNWFSFTTFLKSVVHTTIGHPSLSKKWNKRRNNLYKTATSQKRIHV